MVMKKNVLAKNLSQSILNSITRYMAILLIIAAIMNIIGVNRASKDEAAFKNALIALLFGIAANILVSVFSNNSAINSIGKAAANVRLYQFAAAAHEAVRPECAGGRTAGDDMRSGVQDFRRAARQAAPAHRVRQELRRAKACVFS